MCAFPPKKRPHSTANIALFKAQLAKYIRLVKAGDEIVLTDREKPVARVIPFRAKEPFKLETRKPLDPSNTPLGMLNYPTIPLASSVDPVRMLIEDREKERERLHKAARGTK
jgi:prevent-host-death family protein